MKFVSKLVQYVVYVAVSIVFLSCETDVTDEITLADTTPKLVIDGGLERNITSPLATQQFRITTTNNFLSNEPNPAVTDATVSITDGTQTWSFTHQGDGRYANANINLEVNTTYTITIDWNGETYEGSDTLREAPPFNNFFFEFKEETFFSPEGYVLKFDATDPPNIENYYYYKVFRDGNFIITPDPGNAFNLITSDEFFDGQQRLGVEINGEVVFQVGDIATGQQLGISEKYFDYLFELFLQTGNEGINFGGNPPPATIRSNIINITTPGNRAVGFFYTADVAEASILIEE